MAASPSDSQIQILGKFLSVKLYNGRKQEREAEKLLEERKRKWGEKKKGGPSNGYKLGSIRIESGFMDLNLAWIQKQVKG